MVVNSFHWIIKASDSRIVRNKIRAYHEALNNQAFLPASPQSEVKLGIPPREEEESIIFSLDHE